jgi:hypothetical protein
MRFAQSLIAVSILTVLFSASGCSGCNTATPNGTATIDFKQVGACNGYTDAGVLHNAGPNAAFVVFKVHTIDNSAGKVNFAFDPAKMAVNTGSKPHMDSSLSLATLVGVLKLIPTTVLQGKVVGLDGFAVTTVSTANANGAIEANQTSYSLIYDTGSADPGILFAKENPGQTSWPVTANCTAIAY